jgi:hypothetical protein
MTGKILGLTVALICAAPAIMAGADAGVTDQASPLAGCAYYPNDPARCRMYPGAPDEWLQCACAQVPAERTHPPKRNAREGDCGPQTLSGELAFCDVLGPALGAPRASA